MGIAVSSGNTTVIAAQSCADGLYQMVKIVDGSANSSATVSASSLYGLQVDVSRMPSAAFINNQSVVATLAGTPSVAAVAGLQVNASAQQVGVWSMTLIGSNALIGSVTAIPQGVYSAGVTGTVSISGYPSVGVIQIGALSATLVGSSAYIGSLTAMPMGTYSVALLGGGNISAAVLGLGLSSVTLFGSPSVNLFGTPSVSLFGTPSVAPTTHSVTAMIYNTPSVAPTTHSVTAMIYNTPSVAPTAVASVASMYKHVIFTNTQTNPQVVWSNAATTRWCMTDLMISCQSSGTVTLIDGMASIGRFYFAADGGMVGNYSTPWKSAGIGSNLYITTSNTGSIAVTAVGFETA